MNIFGRICNFCLINKKLSSLVFIGLLFWGAVSFVIMPKRYNPDITAPAFQVRVDFPGATTKEVYELITRPLEDVVNEIEGVDEIYSQSIQGGQSLVTVKFFVGEDMDKSKIRLRQKITTNLDLSPVGVTNIAIIAIDPDNLPVITLWLDSDVLDPTGLRKRAFLIKNELKKVTGTSIVNVVGGRQREFQILLDPDRLRQYEVSLDEIETTLTEKSLFRRLGNIKTHDQFSPIETSGTVRDIKELEDLVILSNVEQQLKIGDIGDVTIGEKETDSYVNFYSNGEETRHAVFISIAKKKGTNITKVSRNILKKITELEDNSPLLKDVTISVLRDEGRVAYEEISGLTINLTQAISIVLILLLLFLNIRAAIVVAISIPLTLLTVIGLGNLVGFTINRITLFALILSLGLLVDSATVVVENIVRNKQLHRDTAKIGIIPSSVSEVGMGLFLSTVTTVLAFIPMRFVTGMMGPYMGPLPFFVSSALIISLIFSYTITPWLAYVFCKEKTPKALTSKRLTQKITSGFMSGYRRGLEGLLQSKAKRRVLLIFSFIFFLCIMSFPALKLLKFRMLPKADREQIYVYLNMPDGTGIDKTYEATREIANLMMKEVDIKSIQSFVGIAPIADFNGLFKGSSGRKGSHIATLRLNLSHKDDRDLKSEDLALLFRQEIKDLLAKYPKSAFQIIEDPPGPPVRATFMAKIKTDNPNLLESVTEDLARQIENIDEVKDIDTSLIDPYQKYYLRVDLEQSAKAQMNTALIAKMLNVLYAGSEIGIYHNDENVEQEYITIKFLKNVRDNIDDLDTIYLMNKLGNPIPISRFIKIDEQMARDVIDSDNRERVAYITAEMGERSVTYATIDFIRYLHNYRLSSGDGKRTSFGPITTTFQTQGGNQVKVEMDGEWKMTLEVFRDLGLAMLVAIALIYFVLVAQFRSYVVPLLILGTIPLALVGVFPGFALLFNVGNIYFSATSMIGVIALSGIVVNNAIILLEYITQKMKTETDFKTCIIEACSVRMRPIFLTSLTTICGSLVIAGDPVWSGLAWSIVFGLSLSALLTLIIFPTLLYHFVRQKD